MGFVKSVGGKVVGGIVALAVIAGAFSWFQMDATSRDELLTGSGRVLGWLGVVALLPWAGFFIIGRIARLESNAAGAAFVLGLTLVEALALAWLFDWSIAGNAGWVFTIAAVLLAGVYNLFTCDWIAEKVES